MMAAYASIERGVIKTNIKNRLTNVQIMRNYTTKIAIESIIGLQKITVDVTPNPSIERNAPGRMEVTGCGFICNNQEKKKDEKRGRTAGNVNKRYVMNIPKTS
ncbi:PREDICTED: uncharacterized protein LOC108374816 [Rhagoletis zephyria]|uniref:uncharacterized protein LOC108374816 n=1 Tax=Rhagoletis zephyria TaxID=28612 RepID=UPI00081146F4|nr:PREDICTED: uncharacterized protein LOC108374816 [Rhagoletis zephyria]